MVKFILSVEDDDASQYLLELALEELGTDLRVYRVTNGFEALKFLQRAEPFTDAPRPHLILSDLNMPRMNGLELLTRLRSDNRFAGIPIIVISSSRLVSDRKACLELGANYFITKSFSYNDFVRAVTTAFQSVGGIV